METEKILDEESISARPGSRINDEEAKVVAKELFTIEKQSTLTPSAVVDVARDPNNPLHEHFEWDDTVAAQEHRLQQARVLISSVAYRVKMQGDNTDRYQRAFVNVSVKSEDEHITKSYVPLMKILRDEDLTKQLLARAKDEMASWITRYKTLKALSDVMPIFDSAFAEIEKVVVKHAS